MRTEQALKRLIELAPTVAKLPEQEQKNMALAYLHGRQDVLLNLKAKSDEK